jgi:hypothetical protein
MAKMMVMMMVVQRSDGAARHARKRFSLQPP